MNVNYLQEVKGDPDGPSCHVCGAIMVKTSWGSSENIVVLPKWKCLSCGTTTGCEEVEPMSNICTCNDLVNNGDHYCPVHGTFATSEPMSQACRHCRGEIMPCAERETGAPCKGFIHAEDRMHFCIGINTLAEPAPSADGRQGEWILLPKLPDEDTPVLIAVMDEAENHGTGEFERFPNVARGTIYSHPHGVTADTDCGEFNDEEILGWKPLPMWAPAPVSGEGRE